MNVEQLKQEYLKDVETITNIKDLTDIRNKYLSKKGLVSELMLQMRDIPNEKKAEFGQMVNNIKTFISENLDALKTKFEQEELERKLKQEEIDITLPATKIKHGAPNILEHIIEEVEEVFMSMGYDVVDGPELEEDKFNFEMLNIPKGHPARDAQDTFYIEDEKILLRSQTSPVQARTMIKAGGNTPIRMICPG